MAGGGLIFCYHSVVAAPYDDPYHIIDRLRLHVTCERFEWQMREIARRFAVVPLDEIDARLSRGASVDGLAAVTFDDGYADNYHHALPILKRLGLPATVFLVTDLIGGAQPAWWDRLAWTLTRRAGTVLDLPPALGGPVELTSRSVVQEVNLRLTYALRAMGRDEREATLASLGMQTSEGRTLLTWDQVREMENHGIGFGAHTCSHPSLPRLPDAELRREVVESRARIVDRLGPDAGRFFAYPFGDVDERVIDVTHRAGFTAALTLAACMCDASSVRFCLPRVILRDWSRREFSAALRVLTRHGRAELDVVHMRLGLAPLRVRLRRRIRRALPPSILRRVRAARRRLGRLRRRTRLGQRIAG